MDRVEPTPLTISQGISLFFKNYANFATRSCIKDWAIAFGFSLVLSMGAGLVSLIAPFVGAVAAVGIAIPLLSATIRRLHDTGKTGWYLAWGLVPLVGWIVVLLQLLRPTDQHNQWSLQSHPTLGLPKPVPLAPTTSVSQTIAQGVETPMNLVLGVTRQQVISLAQQAEPTNPFTPQAKEQLHSALANLVPSYQNQVPLAQALKRWEPAAIKENVAKASTDTLLVAYKALLLEMEKENQRNDIVGLLENEVMKTLLLRLN